jgi:hypothetical protein
MSFEKSIYQRLQKILVALFLLSSMSQSFADNSQKDSSSKNSLNKILKIFNSQTGKTTEIQIPVSSKAELEKLSPEKIRQEYQDLQKNAPKKQGVFASTTKMFVPESATFFVGVGAVLYSQLVLNYANNPIAMEKHIESLADPISHLAFYNFMLVNHSVSAPLMTMIESPKYRAFIPYLGMSAGLTASSLTRDLISDKDLQACAMSLINKKNPNACSQSYYNWVLGPQPKVHNYITGVMSMVASTMVSSAVTITASQLLKIAGVEISTMVAPGGFAFKSGMWMMKFAQIAGFTAANEYFEPLIVYPFQNWRQGQDLADVEKNLVVQLAEQKKNGWQGEECKVPLCRESFFGEVKYMSEAMKAWREMNLSEVTASYNMWLEHLVQLTGMYRFSHYFYGHFANELNLVLQNPTDLKTSILTRSFPLNGVIASEIPQDRQEVYLEWPDKVEEIQQKAVNKAGAFLAQKLSTSKVLKNSIELNEFNSIKNLLLSSNINENSSGISKLIEMSSTPFMPEPKALNKADIKVKYSTEVIGLAQETLKLMGKPFPLLNMGLGYIQAFNKHPLTKEYSDFTSHKDSLSVKMIYNMLCGPDVEKGEKLVHTTKGFSARFTPPQIRRPNDQLLMNCNANDGSTPFNPDPYNDQIFTKPFLVTQGDQQRKYNGAVDYLRQNTRMTFANSHGDAEQFNYWWKKNVEPQIEDSFKTFGNQYKSIVQKLVLKLNSQEQSTFNNGPAANNVLISLLQEQRVYNLILGEIFKDLYVQKYHQKVPENLFDTKVKLAYSKNLQSDVAKSENPIPLIRILKNINNGDMSSIAKLFPQAQISQAFINNPEDFNGPLKFQSQLSNSFNQMVTELQKLSANTDENSAQTNRSVAQNVENLLKSNQQITAEISILFGLGVNPETISGDRIVLNLSPYQSKLVGFLVNKINGLATDLGQMTKIAQAVSWDPAEATKK